jgi:WD40 repeat protein
MRGLSTPAEAVRFSPDGRRLATWSGGRVAVWNLGTGTLDWSAEAGLSEPRPTALWDFPPDAKDRPATPHVCWRPALDWSEDGGLLASATWGASIRLWDADDGHLHGELRSQSTAVYAVAFARGARHMAAGDIGSVRIWDLDLHPGALTWQTGSATTRTWIGLTATGLVWGEAPEGVIHLVDTAAPRTPREWRMAGRGMTAMAVDPRGGRVVAADEGGGVSTWDMRSGTQDRSWSTGSGVVRALAFSHDGTSIATGDDHGNLEIRQAANGSLLRSWRAHGGTILALAFSPDGAFLLSGGTDWHARLWRLRAAGDDPRKTGPPGRPVQDWRHIEWVNAVAFSPDSRHMATGSADLLAFVGHVGGPPDLNSPRHAHWINAVAFLDQGSVLATGGNDEMLRFWDSHTGQELANLPSPGGPIQGLAASGEGRFLAVAGKRAVQLIDLHAAGSLIDRRRR